MLEKFLIAIIIISIIGSVCAKLYYAKKSDNRITKDEIIDILGSLFSDTMEGIAEIKSFKTMNSKEQQSYISNKICDTVSKTNALSDSQQKLLDNNMDTIVNFFVEHYDEIIDKINDMTGNDDKKEIENSTEYIDDDIQEDITNTIEKINETTTDTTDDE